MAQTDANWLGQTPSIILPIILQQTGMILNSICRYLLTHSLKLPRHSHIKYKVDVYRSVHLTPSSKIAQPQFKTYLESIMKAETEGNKNSKPDTETNSVWVHLDGRNLSLISLLCENGFQIHHGLGEKVSLWRWIASKKDLVTPYSMFYVSAGAILIKDDRIFLVQEKNGPRKGDYGIPGGRADFGETIPSCAQRELLEETNIPAKYSHILHMRELEKTSYGAMDIYFACVMKYNEDAFNSIKLCQRELSDYKWIHLKEYQQFCLKNSVGTQYQLAKYISNLYKSGFDFKKRVLNQTTFQNFLSPKDNVDRLVIQHGMVEGCQIDKIYDGK